MREPADIETPTESSPKLKLVRPSRSFGNLQRFEQNWRAIVVGVMFVLGVLLVILGWYGAAHTNIVSEQIPYLISGGLLGLGLIIVSGFMAYSFFNAEQSEQFRRQIADALVARPGSGGGDLSAQPTGGTVYIVPGGKGYHLAGCPIIEGKQGVRELRLIQAIDGGYATCKLCSAD